MWLQRSFNLYPYINSLSSASITVESHNKELIGFWRGSGTRDIACKAFRTGYVGMAHNKPEHILAGSRLVVIVVVVKLWHSYNFIQFTS